MWVQLYFISFFSLTLTGCVTLGKLLNLSMCQLSYLKNGNNIYYTGLW